MPMAKRRWFHMSAKTFEEARAACEDLHASQSASKELRVIWNDEHSACLICLDGASKDWRRPHRWIDDCVEVHCRTSYPGLSKIPVNGNWQPPHDDPERTDDDNEDIWSTDKDR